MQDIAYRDGMDFFSEAKYKALAYRDGFSLNHSHVAQKLGTQFCPPH